MPVHMTGVSVYLEMEAVNQILTLSSPKPTKAVQYENQGPSRMICLSLNHKIQMSLENTFLILCFYNFVPDMHKDTLRAVSMAILSFRIICLQINSVVCFLNVDKYSKYLRK